MTPDIKCNHEKIITKEINGLGHRILLDWITGIFSFLVEIEHWGKEIKNFIHLRKFILFSGIIKLKKRKKSMVVIVLGIM